MPPVYRAVPPVYRAVPTVYRAVPTVYRAVPTVFDGLFTASDEAATEFFFPTLKATIAKQVGAMSNKDRTESQ